MINFIDKLYEISFYLYLVGSQSYINLYVNVE